MNIKMNNAFVCATILSAAIITLASCSRDENYAVEDVGDNTLRFTAGAGLQTMAPIESDNAGLVTSGDVAGIQLLQGTYGSAPKFNEVGAVTRVAKLDGTGLLTYSGAITINTDGSTANFLAYYPAGSMTWGSGTTPAKVTYTIDGNTDIISADCVSKTYSPSNNTVQMAFKHQLARLRLKFVCATDADVTSYQSVTEAKIQVPKTVEMSIPNSGIITSAVKTPIEYTSLDFGGCTLSTSDVYAANELLIHPDDGTGAIKDMEIEIKFSELSEAKTYTLKNLNLVAGKTTTITATISGSKPDVDVDVDANCYIIDPKADEFDFSIDRLNRFWKSADPNNVINEGDAWTAEILWQDVPSGNFIRFYKDNIQSTTMSGVGPNQRIFVKPQGIEGNAVVCVKKNGVIVWSWHLWVTSYNPTYTKAPVSGQYVYAVTDGYVHRYSGNMWTNGVLKDKYIMDRNLGARNAGYSTVGVLYYQWGRKDPLPMIDYDGSATESSIVIDTELYNINGVSLNYGLSYSEKATNGVTIAESVRNPMTFYRKNGNWTNDGKLDPFAWNNIESGEDKKSLFDPCPPGWKVPISGTFDDFTLPSFTSFDQIDHSTSTVLDEIRDARLGWNYGGTPGIRYWPNPGTINGSIYYPAIGYRISSSGKVIAVNANAPVWLSKSAATTRGEDMSGFSTSVYTILSGSNGVTFKAMGLPVRCVQCGPEDEKFQE